MKLLAIDTSATACSLALQLETQVISRHVLAPMQQTRMVLPMLQALLAEQGIDLKQLDAIAFGCGPGSFTGVRIAISVAQGLAYAADLPLIPISSLAAIAQGVYQELGWRNVLVAVDARINEIYWGAYSVQADGLVVLQGQEHVSTPDKLILPDGIDWSGAGNAWDVYRDQLTVKPHQTAADRVPTASALLPLAKAKFLNKNWVAASEAVPVYLRDEVAKKSK